MKVEERKDSKQVHDPEGWDYMNIKFPILYDKKKEAYAVFLNNTEKPISELSMSKKTEFVKLLQTFEGKNAKKEVAEFWDKVTLDYFGGGF